MKRLLIMMVYLFSVSAFAKPTNFDISMELSIGGQLVSKPRLILNNGESGSITMEDKNGLKSHIEVIAKENKTSKGQDVITMDFVISSIAKDGTKTVLARPQMTTTPNDPAQISIDKSNKSEAISFSVLAKKVTR